MEFKDYTKYKWFLTSSGNLVVGGKSADQNESLLLKLKKQKEDLTLMHTSDPGSPFSVILSESPSSSDIQECAIFTASFSKAWKQKKEKVQVDTFKLSQLYKLKSMKTGTWGVKPPVKRLSVSLALVLTKQKDKLRAVPERSIKSKKDILLKIVPGDTDKTLLVPQLKSLLPQFNEEDFLSALPSGGIKIIKK